jgi:prefoldin alpha subunit
MPEQKTITLSGKQIVTALQQERIKLEAIQRTIASVQSLLQEIFFAKESLIAVKNARKEDNKAMVSLGAGVYLDVKINETTKVKTSLSGGVVVNSDIEKAIKDLEEREKETQKKLEELNKQQASVYANMNTLTQIITKAQKARQEESK